MIVPLLSLFENFRGNIVRRAAERCPAHHLHVLARKKQRGESKVTDLGVHILVEKNVSDLEVAVNDTLGVHVLDSAGNLDTVKAHLGLCQAFTPLDHVHQRTIRTQL